METIEAFGIQLKTDVCILQEEPLKAPIEKPIAIKPSSLALSMSALLCIF